MRAYSSGNRILRSALWLALGGLAMTLPVGDTATAPASPQAHLAFSKLSRVRAVTSPERVPGSLVSVLSEKRGRRSRPVSAPAEFAPPRCRPVAVVLILYRSPGTSRPLRC